jgi:hypothetical protein
MSTPLLTGCTTQGCKGRVSWVHRGHWRGKCDKCSLSTRAASSDAKRLDERAEASRG